MKKYKNKYRIETTRLENWDYGWDGSYFVTICTYKRKPYFGEIYDEKMILSEIGKMAEKYWYEIPDHFPFVKLNEFVVMPNHVHGIIIINKKNDNNVGGGDGMGDVVETQNLASLRQQQKKHHTHQRNHHNHQHHTQQNPTTKQKQKPKNKFGPQSKNLPSIVRGYKIGVTKNARKIKPDFKWQSRYYDHIIQNKKSFERISRYIINNPKNWNNDELFY